MPALNFKKQFVPNIKAGIDPEFSRKHPEFKPKRGTMRKDYRGKVGDTLYLYSGQRTKQCEKLGEAVCKEISTVLIMPKRYMITKEKGSSHLCEEKNLMDEFAQSDGFKTWEDLVSFFNSIYGLPVQLKWIKW